MTRQRKDPLPIQHDCELIRDLLLYAETVAARSQATGVDRTTIGNEAKRFVEAGMLRLADQRANYSGRKAHQFPDPVAGYLLYPKQLYPPIGDRELVRIVERKFGYTTNHHTVKRFLQRHALPAQLPLEFTTFHQSEHAYQARWTVVRLYYEGWHIQSIAGFLRLSRKHVWRILSDFEREGFAGLEDRRSRPVDHPANQLSLICGGLTGTGPTACACWKAIPATSSLGWPRSIKMNSPSCSCWLPRSVNMAVRALVSDNGSVFTADAYCALLETLGIEPVYIQRGKPWGNLIEAQFTIQLQIGDAAFARAADFDELQQQHAAFVETFNTTPHWAHRERDDGVRTPAQVLAWVRGRLVAPEELRQVGQPHLYRTLHASPQLELWNSTTSNGATCSSDRHVRRRGAKRVSRVSFSWPCCCSSWCICTPQAHCVMQAQANHDPRANDAAGACLQGDIRSTGTPPLLSVCRVPPGGQAYLNTRTLRMRVHPGRVKHGP